MPITGWMHVLRVCGTAPTTWSELTPNDEAALYRQVADLTLHGFPGGASLVTAPDNGQFVFQIVISTNEVLAFGVIAVCVVYTVITRRVSCAIARNVTGKSRW